MRWKALSAAVSLLLVACVAEMPQREAQIDLRAIREAQTVYLPLALQGKGTSKKGCGGCSLEEMAQISASWSYYWHPTNSQGILGLVKPGIHEVSNAKKGAQREGWLLFANEPDLEGDGGSAVRQYREAETLHVNLVLATGSQEDVAHSWAKAFRRDYRQRYGRWPRITALAAHCYFSPEMVDICIQHIESVVRLAQDWGVSQVWVTEFACYPMSDRRCFTAAEDFIGWMEIEPMVARYAWFGAEENPKFPWPGPLAEGALFNEGITDVGRFYRGLP